VTDFLLIHGTMGRFLMMVTLILSIRLYNKHPKTISFCAFF